MRRLALLIAFCGCVPEVDYLALPDMQGAASVLIAVERNPGPDIAGTIDRVIAIDTGASDGAVPPLVAVERDERIRLTAFVLSKSLDELRIEPGDVPRTDAIGDRAPSLLHLVRWGRLSRLELLGSEPEAPWQEITEVEDAFGQWHFEGDPSLVPTCRTFRPTPFGLPTERNPSFTLTFDDRWAMVGVVKPAPTQLFFFSTDAEMVDVSEDLGDPEFPTTGGFRVGEDEFYFGGLYGLLWKVTAVGKPGDRPLFRVDEKLTSPSVTETSTSVPYRWIDGGETDDGLELFLRSTRGHFERFDANTSTITSLYRFAWTEMQFAHGGVAWIGPGEAIGAAVSSPRLVRYSQGDVFEESVANNTDGLSAVRHIPGAGTFVGTTGGKLFQKREGADDWVEIEGTGTDFPIAEILPRDGGFIIGGVAGFFREYLFLTGFCEAQALFGTSIRYLAPLGEDGYVASGPKPDQLDEAAAVVLRLVE